MADPDLHETFYYDGIELLSSLAVQYYWPRFVRYMPETEHYSFLWRTVCPIGSAKPASLRQQSASFTTEQSRCVFEFQRHPESEHLIDPDDRSDRLIPAIRQWERLAEARE